MARLGVVYKGVLSPHCSTVPTYTLFAEAVCKPIKAAIASSANLIRNFCVFMIKQFLEKLKIYN
jgi:hypothetical protein